MIRRYNTALHIFLVTEKTAIDKMHKSINANSQVFDAVNQQTTTEMLATDILFTLSAIVLVYCIIQL